MQTLLIILDGLCEPSCAPGATPLELASTPAMDRMAAHGRKLRIATCRPGYAPATDCCVLTLLGHHPAAPLPGRGAIEAAGIGLSLSDGDVAYRCNFVRIADGIIAETACQPDGAGVEALIAAMRSKGIELHTTSAGHAIAVISSGHIGDNPDNRTALLPLPNELLGSPLPRYSDRLLNEASATSREILKDSALVFWGGGRMAGMAQAAAPTSLITGVSVMKGIGRMTGMRLIEHPHFTGDHHTDLTLKAGMALRSIHDGCEVTIVHVEAPDSVSHLTASAKLKKETIERIDRELIAPLLSRLPESVRIVLATDHYTDSRVGLHHPDPVPMVICDTPVPEEGAAGIKFCEAAFAHLTPAATPLRILGAMKQGTKGF